MIPLDHLESVVQDPRISQARGGMASDLPLKMIISPDGKVLLAACAGYNNTGLAVIELASKKVVQFFPLPQVWNGLAFSPDGKRVFLAGGGSGAIRVFTYENGKLTQGKTVKPEPSRETYSWPASPSMPSRASSTLPTRPTTRSGFSIPRT